ncbi:MAG: DUF3783 domain-containing protein [Acutalibacteraceae bacterium]
MNNRAIVLAYHIRELPLLTAALTATGFEVIGVSEEQYALPIESLIRGDAPAGRGSMLRVGADSGNAALGAVIREPMLILHGFSDNELDTALDIIRRSGVRVGLKAVTTPTNRKWSSAAIYLHLCAERDAFLKSRGQK